MDISLPTMIQDLIKTQLTVSHLDKKVDCKVVSVDKLNDSIRQKIKNDKGDEFLDGADVLMGFVLEGEGGDSSEGDDKEEDAPEGDDSAETEDSDTEGEEEESGGQD